jgi:DNA-binding CsgD family transcriptional regulator
MKILFISIALIAFSIGVNAQTYEQNQIDSLRHIVDNPGTKDADRIYPLYKLARMYLLEEDSVNVEKSIALMHKLAAGQKDSKYMIFVYNMKLGRSLLSTSPERITTTYQFIDSISTAIARTTDREAQAMGYQYITFAKNRIDNEYDFSDTYKAIDIAEALPDKSTQKYGILFTLYESLFIRNRISRDKANTEKYLNLMLQAAEKSGDKNSLCYALSRKAETNATFFSNGKDIKDIVSQNFTELENFISGNIKFISAFNYGTAITVLLELYALSPNPQYENLIDKHIEQLKKMNFTDLDNRKSLIRVEILYAYAKQDYAKSISLLHDLVKLSENDQTFGVYVLYNNLAGFYSKLNKYKEAYEASEKGLEYYQQFANLKTGEQRQLAEVKFGVEKQQQQIRLQKIKMIYISTTAILLILLLFTMVLILNRQKKINKMAKERAIDEKEKIGRQLIVHTTELDRKGHLLDKMKDMNSEQLEKALQSEQKSGKTTNEYTKLFQEIKLEFYERLNRQAAPNKLSITELKYCAYISLRMSNKDLANVMNVEYNTVAWQKSQLKKKFHLDAHDSLDELIVKFATAQ